MPDETTSWVCALSRATVAGRSWRCAVGATRRSPRFLPVPGTAYVIRLDPAPLPDHPLRIITPIPVSALPAR